MKRISIAFAAACVAMVLAVPASAYEQGTWILRAGVGTVAPESNNLVLPDFPAGGINTTVKVDDGTSLTLTGTYMFRKHWGFDILASWPFTHDISITVVDTLPPGSTASLEIAETDHLPPTFSLQYHFLPDSKFQPYVGAGLNYTTFFSTDVTQDFTDLLGVTKLDLDDSFGLAMQLGADFEFGNNWLINFDVRYINIETDAKLDGAKIGTVDINPWVYAIALGRRF
jgi:outer membrane protein